MAAPTTEKQPIVAFTLDFETGDLDPQEGACTQIAIHAVRIDTFEVLDRYVKYIYPYNKQPELGVKKRKVLKSKFDREEGELMTYAPRALEYSAITMEMLETMGEDIKIVAKEVIEFIRKNTLSKAKNAKPFLIGQHTMFDIGFLQQMMAYAGLTKELEKVLKGDKDFYGNFQPTYIDTILLGQMALSHLPDVTTYKLEVMAERFGIELDDAHDADADVTATTNVAMVCAKRMRNADGGSDGGMTMAKKEKSRIHFKI